MLIKRSLFGTKSLLELAIILGIEYKVFTYYLYKAPIQDQYIEFSISKKSKDERIISAPNSGLKLIQSRLNNILQDEFKPKSCVHGFVKNRNILTNSKRHVRKNIVVNIDLQDFFSSINFGRVRCLFLGHPFYWDNKIATSLANICCHKNILPQGAPTSPIISNYICFRLDNELLKLASENKCTYTRYADDITFSTNLNKLPKGIGEIENNKLILSDELHNTIKNNGFQINPLKTRFAFRNNRQEVTGIVTNLFPNINRKYLRHVRAMIHAWESHGIENAAATHFEKFNYKNKKVTNYNAAFQSELIGKLGYIGFIKGKDNDTYKGLVRKLKILNPEVKLSVIRKENELETLPTIYGEGKTDCKHLKAALNKFQLDGKFIDLEIRFREYDEELEMNCTELMQMCKLLPKAANHKNIIICLLDRDIGASNVKKFTNGDIPYKHWGKKVFSLVLPKPDHRSFDEICIEHLYLDNEIKTIDSHGRRIFLSDEFDPLTGKHLLEEVEYQEYKKLARKTPFIIDSAVVSKENSSIALSKNDFAEYILNKEPSFSNFTFEKFELLFENIIKIIDGQ